MPETKTTPAFILWSLSQACELRTQIDLWQQCEPTERLLRPLQEISRAQYERREFNGFVLHADLTIESKLSTPPLGFAIDEVFAGFGGEEYVAGLCRGCPANVMNGPDGVAGCYGMIFDWGCESIDTAFHRIVRQLSLVDDIEKEFPSTSPCFYGVWMVAPFAKTQLELLAVIFNRLIEEFSSTQLQDFREAIGVALRDDLALHAIHYPPGVVSKRKWRLSPHCGFCKATIEPNVTSCHVCGARLSTDVSKPRNARGVRPYLNLQDVIGRAETKLLVRGYLLSRGASETDIECFFKSNAGWF